MVSIIITNFHTPVLLKMCLKSIQETIGDLTHEIIILDSQSKEANKQVADDICPTAVFIPFNKNVGFAKLVNAGLRQAQGSYVLILNADIILLPKAISNMAAYLAAHPRVGVVAPQLMAFSNNKQISAFRFPTLGAILARRTFLGSFKWGQAKLRDFETEEMSCSIPSQVDWVQGSVMMVKKEALMEVGEMDERFFMYFEDTDWCRRFWNKQYEVIYLPSAQVAHYYGRHSKKWGWFLDPFLNKYARMHLISAAKYFWKWRNSRIQSI